MGPLSSPQALHSRGLVFRIFGVILLGFWQFGGLWALAGLGFVWVLHDWGPGTCRQEQLVRLKHVSLPWKQQETIEE